MAANLLTALVAILLSLSEASLGNPNDVVFDSGHAIQRHLRLRLPHAEEEDFGSDVNETVLVLASEGPAQGGTSQSRTWLLAGLPDGINSRAQAFFQSLGKVRVTFTSHSSPDDEAQVNSKLPEPLKKLMRISPAALVVPTLLGFSVLGLLFVSMMGGVQAEECFDASDASIPSGTRSRDAEPKDWSVPGIVALTSYRFYTGFLGATWMPYLLAMEGHELASEQQSFFMGCAKLIYGMSILFNPLFGLLGDHMTTISHWSGRRLFIILGVGISGLGIYGCMIASEMKDLQSYFFGAVLWMLGEAMADVTTETLVPELLPQSQFAMSSSIRSLNFLLGGLAGYSMLIAFRQWEYSWLYYGYLFVMLGCAFLSLLSINQGRPGCKSPPPRNMSRIQLRELLHGAYVSPTQMQGGFPRACLCLFVFSLGSAPMMFLLLMIRDIVGVRDAQTLQMHFGYISIVFFLSAALASAAVGAKDGDHSSEVASETENSKGSSTSAGGDAASSADAFLTGSSGASPTRARESGIGFWLSGGDAVDDAAQFAPRWWMMIRAVVAFGTSCLLSPLIWAIPTVEIRICAFYANAVFFGLAFGCVYCKFQECTWSLLPPGVDVANAMGFAAMCKLAGVGFGNFVAGIVLYHHTINKDQIGFPGYLIMCSTCAGVVFLSAFGVFGVAKQATAAEKPSAVSR